MDLNKTKTDDVKGVVKYLNKLLFITHHFLLTSYLFNASLLSNPKF